MTKQERDAKLDLLEEQFTAWLDKKAKQLEQERQILELVLAKQGFLSATRRSANASKLRALASVKALIPGNKA